MPDTWPVVGRVLHFAGGLRGENPPRDNKVYFTPTIPNQEPFAETLESFASIYKLSDKYGLLLGVDFYQPPEQGRGIYPPEWRVYTYGNGEWLGFDISQKMAEIRNNAYQQGKYDFVDCIGKVESWLKASSRALRGISESYYQALSARCKAQNYVPPQAFDDMNCDYVGDSLHNFLYYMGTLRDHIAEFIIFYAAKNIHSSVKKDPKMSKLKAILEKDNADYGIQNIKQRIYAGYDILTSSDILPGWLYLLGEYRNIITHEKPINMIACKSWTWQLTHKIAGTTMPFLKFPIPTLPLTDSDYFQSAPNELKEKLKRVAASQDFMLTNPDGLEVAWRIFIQMLIFLNHVLDVSPVKPKPIHINSSNSWGFRKIY